MAEAPGPSDGAVGLLQEFKKDRAAELDLAGVEGLANQFQADLDKEAEIKDEIRTASRKLEREVKTVIHALQRIHLEAESAEKTKGIGIKGMGLVDEGVVPAIACCASKIPAHEYHRYSDFFRFQMVKAVFSVGLCKFLQDGDFATIEFVAQKLKLPTPEGREKGTIFLEWEVYLEGMIDVGQELARLAKNCVILDNFSLVSNIHAYISTLTYGFSALNFRNDGLRRRYDSLKYDARAIEEVVYDLKMQKK